MWKKILLGVIVLLAVIVGGFLVSPYGPLVGGALVGERVEAPVDDWSFVTANRFCKFEVSRPEPRSFTVTCLSVDAELYVGCMQCPNKSWPPDLAANPEARYLAGGKLYDVNATLVSDPSLRQRIWDSRGEVDELEVTPVPDSYWIYRLSSR